MAGEGDDDGEDDGEEDDNRPQQEEARPHVSLEERARGALDDFDGTPSARIVEILGQIRPHFAHGAVSEYLQKKIQAVLDADTEAERKAVCRTLRPYLDWYLQGAAAPR